MAFGKSLPSLPLISQMRKRMRREFKTPHPGSWSWRTTIVGQQNQVGVIPKSTQRNRWFDLREAPSPHIWVHYLGNFQTVGKDTAQPQTVTG